MINAQQIPAECVFLNEFVGLDLRTVLQAIIRYLWFPESSRTFFDVHQDHFTSWNTVILVHSQKSELQKSY